MGSQLPTSTGCLAGILKFHNFRFFPKKTVFVSTCSEVWDVFGVETPRGHLSFEKTHGFFRCKWWENSPTGSFGKNWVKSRSKLFFLFAMVPNVIDLFCWIAIFMRWILPLPQSEKEMEVTTVRSNRECICKMVNVPSSHVELSDVPFVEPTARTWKKGPKRKE